MGWSLPPGKKWGGPPDWGIIDDPDYPDNASGGNSPQILAPAPSLDFDTGDDTQSSSQTPGSYQAARGRANLNSSYATGGSGMDDYSNYDFGYMPAEQGEWPADSGGYDAAGPTYGGWGQDDGRSLPNGVQSDNGVIYGQGGGGGYSAPMQYMDAGAYDMMRGAAPTGASDYYNPPVSHQASPEQWAYMDRLANQTSQQGSRGQTRSGGGGGAAPAATAPYGMTQVNLGSPERRLYDAYTAQTQAGPQNTLYNRYSQLLQNPAGMSQDPAFQFLFNQGMQGLNRSMAAKKMALSGKSGQDAIQFGEGNAANYMNQMMPLYAQGAGQEMSRFLGQNSALGNASGQELNRWTAPAGMALQQAGFNNNVQGQLGQQQAAQDLLPYYQNMLSQSSGGSGYGGMSSGASGYPQGGGYSQPGVAPNMGAGYNGMTPGGQGYRQMVDPQTLQTLLGNQNYGLDWASGMSVADDPYAVYQN